MLHRASVSYADELRPLRRHRRVRHDAEDSRLDLLVLGGGVMGLFTAYHAGAGAARVAVLERGEIGDPTTASYGRTRSYRQDYLDPGYARLADEATRLWTRLRARNRHRRARALRLHEHRQGRGHTRSRRHLRAAERRRAAAPRAGVRTARPRGVGCALPRTSTPTSATSTRRPGSSTCAPSPRRSLRVLHDARGRAARAHRDAVHRAATATLLRVRTDAGEFVARSLVITAGPRHQRRTGAAARVPAARAAHPRPTERGQVLPARRRGATAVHLRRHAGDRLSRHRGLRPPHRRRASSTR